MISFTTAWKAMKSNSHLLIYAASALAAIFLCGKMSLTHSDFGYVPWIALGALILFHTWAQTTHKERRGNWFHPVVFFFIGFFIVYYQNPLLHCFGWETNMDSRWADYAPYGCAIALLALSSFLIGYAIVAKPGISPYRRQNRQARLFFDLTPEKLSKISFGLAVAGGILALLHYGMYWESYAAGVRPIFMQIPNYKTQTIYSTGYLVSRCVPYICYAAVLLQWLYVFTRPHGNFRDVFHAFDKRVLFLYLFSMLPPGLLGLRMSLIYSLAILIGPFFYFVRPLRFKSFAYLMIIGAVAFAVVGMYRANSPGRTLEQRTAQTADLWKKLGTTGSNLPTSNMAWSNNVFNLALEQKMTGDPAPNHYPGRYFVQECLTVIPGFGLLLHQMEYRDRLIGNELSYHYFYPNPPKTSISSTSIVTFYYEFGLWGVPFLFAVIGLIVRKIEERCSESPELAGLTLYSFLAPMLFITNRMNMAQGICVIIKTVLTVLVLTYAAILMESRTKKDSSLRQHFDQLFRKLIVVSRSSFSFLYSQTMSRPSLKVVLPFAAVCCLAVHLIFGDFGKSELLRQRAFENEISALQSELLDLNPQLEKSRSETQTVKNQLEKSRTETQIVKNQLEKSRMETQTVKSQLEKFRMETQSMKTQWEQSRMEIRDIKEQLEQSRLDALEMRTVLSELREDDPPPEQFVLSDEFIVTSDEKVTAPLPLSVQDDKPKINTRVGTAPRTVRRWR